MDLSPHIKSNLGWIKVLLNPKVPYGSPIEERPIDYRYTGQETLRILAESGLPVLSSTPFMFDYVEVFAPYLSSHDNPDLFFSGFIDLMIREWALWFGRKTFSDNFGGRAAWQKTAEEILKQKAREDGLELFSQRGRRMEPWIPEAKWIVDSTVFQLRAIWDVMLVFMSEQVLGFRLNAKKLDGRRRELQRKASSRSLTVIQEHLVEIFLSMTGDIGWVKNYRDAELHRIGRRFLGALEHEKTAEYLWDAWSRVIEEHNRAREGLVGVVGTLIGTGVP